MPQTNILYANCNLNRKLKDKILLVLNGNLYIYMYMCMYICMYVCCTHEEWKYNFSQKGVMKNKYNCKETSKTYHCITNFLLNSGSMFSF